MKTFGAADLVETFSRLGYTLAEEQDTKVCRPNIFGVRSSGRTAGKFDDLLGIFWQEGDAWKMEVWDGTTDPGLYYLQDHLLDPKGCAILVPDQYRDVYAVDLHRSAYRAVCQRLGPVRVYRDKNMDGVLDLDPPTVESGEFGINIHRDGYSSGESDILLKASAGCQVFRRRRDFETFMPVIETSIARFGNRLTYTLLDEDSILNSPTTAALPTISLPASSELPIAALAAARFIFDWEARKDAAGKLIVYRLPAGDGGGAYEVAGINAKFHPEKAAQLKRLVENGDLRKAEEDAIDYIAGYVSEVGTWHSSPAVGMFLMDCAFNRGPTGAARILQQACKQAGTLKGAVDGKVGPATKAAARTIEPESLLARLLLERQRYELVVVGRDESSQFWRGLTTRWVKVHAAASRLL